MKSQAQQVENAFKLLQDEICQSLENLDGQGVFKQDLWNRAGGGGGRTRIIKGKLIASGGVNFSAVHGTLSEAAGKSLGTGPGKFFATGVSIVLHPVNPWMPIIHMNVRYFEMSNDVWWFGGGIDLTPHYIDPSMAKDFHSKLKATCDQFEFSDYDQYKKHADDYFFIKHRNETRGIGGIFYDRLTQPNFEDLLGFSLAVGRTFVPAYTAQANAFRDKTYSEQELAWQGLRRGRYVEFNLVLDRGTRFGLETNGRTESILMSLPPMANWTYNFEPTKGSKEEFTLQNLKKDKNWLI